MDVKLLDDTHRTRWDEFVNACPEATFFHRAGWKEVIERAFGHRCYFLYAQESGRIQGVLPLGHVRSLLFGNTLISSPFCVYGGVAAYGQEARDALTQAAVRLAEELEVDCLEMRNRHRMHPAWPCKGDLYVTFRKAIDLDPEKNMLNIPRKQRAMVRKGIDAGLISKIDAEIGRFYQAYAHSVRNLGTPVFSARYFEILQQVFAKDCDILTITKDDKLVASVMSFYFRDEILPYYGGGSDMAREYKGNDFMYWELMRHASERGVRVFDYGRSKVGTGSYSFKKNWGFEPEPLYYEYYLVHSKKMPDINPLNPKYKLFIELWKRMPMPVTKWLGPAIVKNLG